MTGAYLMLEGGEGSDKDSHGKSLVEFLNPLFPKDVILTREPGGTPEAEQIR